MTEMDILARNKNDTGSVYYGSRDTLQRDRKQAREPGVITRSQPSEKWILPPTVDQSGRASDGIRIALG
jgi:hypothetical protein